jgi:hypothetical protein
MQIEVNSRSFIIYPAIEFVVKERKEDSYETISPSSGSLLCVSNTPVSLSFFEDNSSRVRL